MEIWKFLIFHYGECRGINMSFKTIIVAILEAAKKKELKSGYS